MRTPQILWVLLKTAIFTAVVPFTVGWWLPGAVHRRYPSPALPQPWCFHGLGAQFLANFLLSLGALIYLWCAWDFSVKGLGTPAPIDAPKNLVVNGLYRYVRNPMYLGVAGIVVSRTIFFCSLPILFYLVFILLCANLFVRFHEEPHLRAVFGEPYLDYCGSVPRWLPRFR